MADRAMVASPVARRAAPDLTLHPARGHMTTAPSVKRES
jgi:hypothetical protein